MKYEDLKVLDELREKGSITEEEYRIEKEKLLSDQGASSTDSVGRKPLFGFDENTYLMLMHFSQFAGFVIPLAGFVAPILMWTTNKDTNANVDRHGKSILNCMISYVLYSIVLCVTLIGIPVAVVLGVLYIIFVVIAALKANSGEFWKYPLTIKFIK